MKKDGPLLPRILECSGQPIEIGYDPESLLRVRMLERIRAGGNGRRYARATGGNFDQRFGSFLWQMIGQVGAVYLSLRSAKMRGFASASNSAWTSCGVAI